MWSAEAHETLTAELSYDAHKRRGEPCSWIACVFLPPNWPTEPAQIQTEEKTAECSVAVGKPIFFFKDLRGEEKELGSPKEEQSGRFTLLMAC